MENYTKWDRIKELKDGYILEYYPARTTFPLASLSITFLTHIEKTKIIEILELEFAQWAKLYPVPLFASAFDNSGDSVDLSPEKEEDYMNGYYNPAEGKLFYKWGSFPEEEIPSEFKTEENLKKCYANIPFKTSQEILKEVDEHNKKIRTGLKLIRSWFFFWLLLIPIIMFLIGENSPWVAYVALGYTLWKAWREYSKITGRRKKSAKDLEKEERERKKSHYYYHCERNPEDFLRLKIKNFERESKEQILKEAQELELKKMI